MTQVQTFNFGNIAVSFREDGYLNATQIAAHFGKLPKDYLKTEQTQQYISALAESLSERTKILTDENQLVIVKKGNSKNFTQGTWLHPKLAIHFARWLDPKFAVWCDEQIEALLNGKVSDGLPAKTTADDRTPLRQAVAALVGRKGIDYSTAYGMIHQRFNVGAARSRRLRPRADPAHRLDRRSPRPRTAECAATCPAHRRQLFSRHCRYGLLRHMDD